MRTGPKALGSWLSKMSACRCNFSLMDGGSCKNCGGGWVDESEEEHLSDELAEKIEKHLSDESLEQRKLIGVFTGTLGYRNSL